MRTLPRFILSLLGLALVSQVLADDQRPNSPRQSTPAITFYVATDGNDQNPGTKDKSFATLDRARDAVRTAKRPQEGQPLRPITVLIRGGLYFMKSPWLLTPEDSGTAQAPITFAAYPDEKPILSGGRQIKGWKETMVGGKPLWSVELLEVSAGKWYFHQLWVNGQRRQRARHPHDGFLQIAALPEVKKDNPNDKGQNSFQFAAGDMKAWENLQDVDIVAMHLWVAVRLPVESVDEKQRLATFVSKSTRRLVDGAKPARYYLENAFEFLDTPGEWYLNRKTGTLYYWPLPGEKTDAVETVAPVLPYLLRFDGKPETKQTVDHVTVRGLNFAHSGWWPARTQAVDDQAAVSVPAAIQGNGMNHCSLEDCTIAHVGNYGIHLARGCKENRIVGCDLFDLGAGGVEIGETAIRDEDALQTGNNAVTDNHIHDGGRIFHQAVGVWIGQSFGNRIAHNHIHDLYYTGISCGWTWGYGKTLARDNIIEFNHVHDLGKEWLSDMGGIYTLGTQPGTVIRSNIFHDIAGYRYGGWGIYYDEGSTGIVAENNLVYNITHGGFHQHYGKENIVRNNILAFGRDAQVMLTRPEPHRSFTFERNIVYWKQGKLLGGIWDREPPVREGITPTVVMDHNLYWQQGGGEVRFGKLTWDQWRAKGLDINSVIADPLFINVDKHEFRLEEKSPALKLGFVPPDLTKVGPRPQAQRTGVNRPQQ